MKNCYYRIHKRINCNTSPCRYGSYIKTKAYFFHYALDIKNAEETSVSRAFCFSFSVLWNL